MQQFSSGFALYQSLIFLKDISVCVKVLHHNRSSILVFAKIFPQSLSPSTRGQNAIKLGVCTVCGSFFSPFGRDANAIKLSDLSGAGWSFSPSGRDAEGREGNTLYKIFRLLFP